MQQYFFELFDGLTTRLKAGEVLLGSLSGEDSDFVRFNHGMVRQATNVRQRYLALNLIAGRRHLQASIALAGEPSQDSDRAEKLLEKLHSQLPFVPEDPYLLYSTDVSSGTQSRPDKLPSREDAVSQIVREAGGRDLVGIYSSGSIFGGFANSLGQRNWFSTSSFCFDWSFYHAEDKGVKTVYAAFEWDKSAFQRKMQSAGEQLEILARPAKTIEPGRYPVYIAPSAMNEFVALLFNGGGASAKSHRTRRTPLLKMVAAGATLSPAITVRENTSEGIGPNFESDGFIKPPTVTLIDNGRFRDCLASGRSAREYGIACNGANTAETPQSIDVSAGDIAPQDVLSRLDTGVYINSVWYLNFSDRPEGRITGMTRFATFWVEGGRIVAPLNVMRFDETVYRMLGDNLIGLTASRDFIPSAATTGCRSAASARMPGAMVKDFTFTL